MSEHGLDLRLGAAAYPLTLIEAEILRDWLHGTPSLPGQTLASALTAKLGAARRRSRSVMLGMDDIAALRDVICGADVGDHAGLRSLQTSLCVEA